MTPHHSDAFIAAAKPFLRNLDKARKRARIYPPEHPYVQESRERLVASLNELLLVHDSITVSISEGDIFIEGRHIPDDDGLMEPMISDLTRRELMTADESLSPKPAPGMRLTAREREVLRLLAGGARSRDIAEALFISERTVKTHVASTMQKLNANTRAEAVAKAIQSGLLPGDET